MESGSRILGQTCGKMGGFSVLACMEEEDLQAISKLLQPINDKIDILNQKVTGLEVHLENMTDKNIRTAAESHLERKIKERLDQTATA